MQLRDLSSREETNDLRTLAWLTSGCFGSARIDACVIVELTFLRLHLVEAVIHQWLKSEARVENHRRYCCPLGS
jgi:hypothetical protein